MLEVEQQQKEAQTPPATREQVKNDVTEWIERIKASKKKFKDDFKRMRNNMSMTWGLQWTGQKKMRDSRYVANWCNQHVNEKVAQLYARNPKVEYQRRPRLDFQLYNGRLESLLPVVQAAASNPLGLGGLPFEQQALLADFSHGMEQRDLIDRVGKTMEYAFQYQMDEQVEEEGEFKTNMKHLVRTAVTCGVGFVRTSFARDIDAVLLSTGGEAHAMNRLAEARRIMEEASEGDIDDTSPKLQTLSRLASSLQYFLADQTTDPDVKERLVFDFISPTQLIVDPNCRYLKGFVGARWIAFEYVIPLNDVNALFETRISTTQGAKLYTPDGTEKESEEESSTPKENLVCLWEVLDKKTGTTFFLVDGYEGYISDPEPVNPKVRGFWPVDALMFNDCVVEPDMAASIYPPSDVDLLFHAQKEWNRTRNELKKHRKGNAPGYFAPKGMLTDNDRDSIENADTNEVVELEGVPVGTDLSKVIIPRNNVTIQPTVYDSGPLREDIQMAIGQAPPPNTPTKRATATGEQIAENRTLTVTGSNVDDLDDFLSSLACKGGEIMLKEMSVETIKRICGPGAAWPQIPGSRTEYLNQIYLVAKAASSGRPNKILDLNNWQIIAPILMQNGANPMFVVRESLRRLDDQLDSEQAFPLVPPDMQANNLPQGGEHQPSEQGQHVPGQTMPPAQARPGPSAPLERGD